MYVASSFVASGEIRTPDSSKRSPTRPFELANDLKQHAAYIRVAQRPHQYAGYVKRRRKICKTALSKAKLTC